MTDKHGNDVAPHVTAAIAAYLSEHNPLVQGYETFNEQIAAAERFGDLGDICLVVHGTDRRPADANHARNWDVPSDGHGLSACVITSGNDDDLRGYWDYPLVVRARADGGKLSYVNRGSAVRHALRYPLVYPHGEEGYHRGLEKRDASAKYRRISPTMWASYHMHDRQPAEGEEESSRVVNGVARRFSCLLEARNLYGEVLLDWYLGVEGDRLNWQALNQKTIRAETYEGVKAAVLKDTGAQIGRRVILAPSFTGGPRHYAACFRDAMAIVRKHGRPDLFITLTCNPNW